MLRVLGGEQYFRVQSHGRSNSLFQRRCFYLGVLPDSVDRTSKTYARNSKVMEGLVSDLHSHIGKVLAGGEEAVRRNQRRNKLVPREWINGLIDHGSSFLELSQLAGHDLHEEYLPSAGKITGIGPVHGRICIFVANDPTVKGGATIPS